MDSLWQRLCNIKSNDYKYSSCRHGIGDVTSKSTREVNGKISLTRAHNHNDTRILCSEAEYLSYLTILLPDDYFTAQKKGFDEVERGLWDEKKALKVWHAIQGKEKHLKREK
eukprot:6075354-Ditylum_brightwellii.AAC.1